jgi:integrase
MRIVAINPCEGIDDNPTNSRDRILSESEVPLFWKACDSIDPLKALTLKVALLVGQRSGELRHMHRAHVKDGWWLMPGLAVDKPKWPGTKNSLHHRVWLSRPVIELIGDGTGFVFANQRGNAVGPLDDAMREISKLCSFNPPVTAHDLRRTFGSTVTGRGHGRDAMDRILNHFEKGSTTNTYDRSPYLKEDRLIMEDVAAAIMRMVDGKNEENVIAGEFRKAQ